MMDHLGNGTLIYFTTELTRDVLWVVETPKPYWCSCECEKRSLLQSQKRLYSISFFPLWQRKPFESFLWYYHTTDWEFHSNKTNFGLLTKSIYDFVAKFLPCDCSCHDPNFVLLIYECILSICELKVIEDCVVRLSVIA